MHDGLHSCIIRIPYTEIQCDQNPACVICEFAKVYFAKWISGGISPKFNPAKVSLYTVARYDPLLTDLEHTGFFVELVTIKVGCLGHFLPSVICNLCRVCHLQKCSVRSIFEQAARVAISYSYRIFNARSSELWDIMELLTVF